MWKPRFLTMDFGKTFWATIMAEIFERGAWYGFFLVAPIYLTAPVSEGALGLSHAQKGFILAIVPAFLYIVPLFSGALGDIFGYRKVLLSSFVVLAAGYVSGLYGKIADKVAMYTSVLVDKYHVDAATLKDLSVYDLARRLQEHGADLKTVDSYLWQTHMPHSILLIPAGIGLATVIALAIYRAVVPSLTTER